MLSRYDSVQNLIRECLTIKIIPMKKITFLFVLLAVCLNVTNATTYFVDASASTNGNGLSPSTPKNNFWSISLAAYDIIYFKAGVVNTAGIYTISANNITIGRYGTGNNPEFTNPSGWTVFNVTGNNFKISDVSIYNTTYSAITLGGNNGEVSNCWITIVAFGVAIKGDYCYVHHNTFKDLKMQHND